MPKIYLPFKRKVYSFFTTTLILLYAIWKILLFGALESRSSFLDLSIYILPVFIIALILFVIDLLPFVFKDDELMKMISFKDEFSFNIIEERINRHNKSLEKITDKRINWKTIKDIELFDDFKEIRIRLDTDESIKIQDDYENFYLLLAKLSNHSSFDKQKYKEFLADLETCPICGMIAKYKTRCCSCFAQFPEGEIVMDEVLKEAQVVYFTLQMDEQRNIDFFKESDNGFVKDPEWEPIVRKKDLIDFLDENIKTVPKKV